MTMAINQSDVIAHAQWAATDRQVNKQMLHHKTTGHMLHPWLVKLRLRDVDSLSWLSTELPKDRVLITKHTTAVLIMVTLSYLLNPSRSCWYTGQQRIALLIIYRYIVPTMYMYIYLR